MLASSEFYNAIANDYKEYCFISNINMYLKKEVDVVQSFNPQSILEFGIGDGRFARAYLTSNPGTYYVGVDNAEEMLNLAQDSGATLICSDFVDYLAKVILEGERFGCIVAPYTAIHHVKTSTQLELFEMMKQVADVLIINCLTTEAEKIFNEKDETEVTVQLPDGCTITTTVYLLHRKIRAQTAVVPESTHREFLVFKK